MRDEYDFSSDQFPKPERGKFYRKGATFTVPLRLEGELHAHYAARAAAKGVSTDAFINDLLRASMEPLDAAE